MLKSSAIVMKVMFLNIFEGCQEKERFQKIVSFVKRANPDVLGLSELYNWDRRNYAKLKIFLKQTRFKFHVFYRSANKFHVGIFSKYPLSQAADISEGVGMAKPKVTLQFPAQSFSVVVAHLSHIDEDTRLREVDIILRHVRMKEPTIIMGDFNALSPLDRYDDAKVLQDMRKAGIDKFGRKKLRKEVIKKIMATGFIDAVRAHSKKFEYSVPTKYCKDKNHFTKLRLDYLFITDPLLRNLRNARIIRTAETNQLSDHFPLLAEFTPNK